MLLDYVKKRSPNLRWLPKRNFFSPAPFFFLCFYFFILVGGSVSASDSEKVKQYFKEVLPGERAAAVSPSPIPGILEVILGSSVFYITKDARYVLKGELIDVLEKKNLTAKVRSRIRMQMLSSVEKKELITFTSHEKLSRAEVYVYTDIDCGYCRKFHLEVAKINQAGITVNYLFFPRKGIKSSSYEKAVSVWCSVDRKAALTNAKKGEVVKSKTCENPVSEHFELGVSMGVMGTPAIYSSEGLELGGYLSADELKKEILN